MRKLNRDRLRWICLILSIILFLLLWSMDRVSAQGSADRAVPVETYWQKIDQAYETVQGLEGADDATVQAALGSLAAEFGAIKAVVLADGRQIPMDNGYLISLFQEPEPDLTQLETYLAAVQASHDRWPEPVHDAQDLVPLTDILARPEFQAVEEEPGLIQRIWQRVVDAFLDFLLRIFPQSTGGLGPIVRFLLTIFGLVALAAVLYFTLRGFLADLVSDESSSSLGDGGPAMISADQALDQARLFSATGDYRSAVRYLYLSSLLLLEERGMLRYDRTQTNQEYLRSVAGSPELAAVLREVIDVVDRVWYGFQSLDDQAFSHYAGLVERLKQQR